MVDKMLEKRVKKLEDRNRRVDQDKAWETSWTRRLVIGAGVYGFAYFYLTTIETQNPPLEALVPATGYILSTLALLPIRRLWKGHHKKHHGPKDH